MRVRTGLDLYPTLRPEMQRTVNRRRPTLGVCSIRGDMGSASAEKGPTEMSISCGRKRLVAGVQT
jgi:hypothetical protein